MATKEKATPTAGARSKASGSGRGRAGATAASTAKPAVSPARGNSAWLRFHAGWREELEGDIVPGGKLRVDYAPQRLPDYRGTYKNKPTWDIVAMVLFSPGGQLQSGSVAKKPLEVVVPSDASEVTLWFQNTDGSGGAAWDSRYGENYRFGVSSAAAGSRAAGGSSRTAGATGARAKSAPASARSTGGASASRARGATAPASGRASGGTSTRASGARATGGATKGSARRGGTLRARGSG
jgi:Family of unknown function (DUF6209)